jgi:uncharacterized membrane protein YdjX (TVP38/TMEM64 family)
VAAPGWSGTRWLILKAVALMLLALVGALLARHPGVRAWTSPAGRMAQALGNVGWVGIPAFILGSGLLMILGVPRLLFCPLAGAAFGFWGGFVTSTVATMGAYFASFLFIRGRLADRETPFELPPRLAFLRHDPGVGGVILTRLIPLPSLIGTAALSLSPVRKRSFFWGSLVGLVPEAVPLLLFGAGVFEQNTRHLAWLGAGALLLLVASLILIRRLLRKHRNAPSPGEVSGD